MPRSQPNSRSTVSAHKKWAASAPSDEIHRFTSGETVRAALRVTDIAQLINNLTALRNQWTVHRSELASIPSDDARLLLAKSYLDLSSSATEIFSAWELLSKQSIVHQHLALGVLAALLTLLSTQYIYHPLGLAVLRQLLSFQWSRKLNAHLNSTQTDLVLVALKLWNAMSNYAGGVERKSVYDEFHWGNKSLARLYHMRRKGQIDTSADPFIKPDIRTLYMMFILSFVQPSTLHIVKATFLESHREVFLGLFKRLSDDHYMLVRHVLEACWEGIWLDPKLRRTLKIGLFNVQTLSLLVKLYSRTSPEGTGSDGVPADLVHHFLLALCTHPGTGLCFKDGGWYPKEDDDMKGDENDEDNQRGNVRGTRVYNVVIQQLLRHLKPTEDSRNQELALKIFRACPELVSVYWSSSGLGMEPRLSSKWFINISWISSIISLPVPDDSFRLGPDTKHEYKPTPPPLHIILDNIIPPIWPKSFVTKGLQGASPLVQRSTAMCLGATLEKYERVLQYFRKIEAALEEDEESGQWKQRRREVEKEFRRKVPNFEVIVAFSQQNFTTSQRRADIDMNTPAQMLRNAMVTEIALRLMWDYHRSLPDLPAEARYDVGKLLLSDSVERQFSSAAETFKGKDLEMAGFDSLSLVHVLRILQCSNQFIWSSPLGDTNQTQLYRLLKILVFSTKHIVSECCTDLVHTALAHSVLFDHDPSELAIWLEYLPRTIRSSNAKGPNGEELVDERETVVMALDRCIRECIRSPWSFAERSVALLVSGDYMAENGAISSIFDDYSPSAAASPLLIALMDLFEGLLKGNPGLPTSAVLAIATYLRQVLLGISLKQPDTQYITRVLSYLNKALETNVSDNHSKALITATQREFILLDHALSLTEKPGVPRELSDDGEVSVFLSNLEGLAVDPERRVETAYDLVDWVRLNGRPLSTHAITRAVALIRQWHAPALRELVLEMDPSVNNSLSVLQKEKLYLGIPFAWVYLQLSFCSMEDESLLEYLATLGANSRSIEAMCRLFLRRLRENSRNLADRTTTVHTLKLWASVIRRGPTQRKQLHRHYALGSTSLKALLYNPTNDIKIKDAIVIFVRSLLDPDDTDDRHHAREFCEHWVYLSSTKQISDQALTGVVPWVPFLSVQEIFLILDSATQALEQNLNNHAIAVLMSTLIDALNELDVSCEIRDAALLRLRGLLKLKKTLQENAVLHQFALTQFSTLVPVGFVGDGLASITVTDIEERWNLARNSSSLSALGDFFSYLHMGDTGDIDLLVPCLYRSKLLREQTAHLFVQDTSTYQRVPALLYHLLDASAPNDSWIQERLIPQDMDQQILYRIIALMDDASVRSLLQEHSCTHISSLVFISSVVNAYSLTPKERGKVIEMSMKGIVSFLSDENTDSFARKRVMSAIVRLAKSSVLSADLCDAFFVISVQEHLGDEDVLAAFSTLIIASNPKPATINRLLQAILHHPQFGTIATSTKRHALVDALYNLFQSHPQNTCQLSHVKPLISIYRGTLERSDRQILHVFQMLEEYKKISCSALMSHWASTSSTSQNGVLNAITGLDPVLMFKSCTEFPRWRSLAPQIQALENQHEDVLYDPVFVMLLLGLLAVEEQEMSSIDWVQLFRSNATCLLVMSLSSGAASIRNLGWAVFGGLFRLLEKAEFQEKSQAVYMLRMLACLYSTPDGSVATRLPTFTTLFFAHAIRALFSPSSNIYPLISRFLLQRPEFDTRDPSMLYSMLYSSISSEGWKKDGNWRRERLWMLKFLADGMKASMDWEVLRRRHTWDLLASTFEAHESDKTIRMGVLSVLVKLCKAPKAATSLLLRSHLLSWIETQTRRAGNLDTTTRTMWLSVIEEVLINSDHARVERSTAGGWRPDLLRCLGTLLQNMHGTGNQATSHLDLLLIAARILQRISILPYGTKALSKTLRECVDALRDLERKGSITISGIHSTTWAEVVQRLWLTMMAVAADDDCFEALTARVVALSAHACHSSPTESNDDVALWVRREAKALLSGAG